MEFKYFDANMTEEQINDAYRKYIAKYHNGDPKSEAIFSKIRIEYQAAKEQARFNDRKRAGNLTGWDKAIMAEDAAREAIGKATKAASSFASSVVSSAIDEHERRVAQEEKIRRNEQMVSKSLGSKKYTKEDYARTIEEYKKYILDRLIAICRCSNDEVGFLWGNMVFQKTYQGVWEHFQYKMVPEVEGKGIVRRASIDGHLTREKLEWIVWQSKHGNEMKTEEALLKLEVYFGQFIVETVKKIAQKYSDPIEYIDREKGMKDYWSKPLSKKVTNRYKSARNHFTFLFVIRFGVISILIVLQYLALIKDIIDGYFSSFNDLVIWTPLVAIFVFFYIKGAFGNARRHLRSRRARFDLEQMRIDSKKGPIFRFMVRHDMI